MKLPQKFNKMTIAEQESYLVEKYQKCVIELQGLQRLLASVRGGSRVDVKVEERPDETVLKQT